MRRKPPPPVTLPLFPWPTPRTDDFRNPLSHPIPSAARGTPLSPASPPALRCTGAGVLADEGGGGGGKAERRGCRRCSPRSGPFTSGDLNWSATMATCSVVMAPVLLSLSQARAQPSRSLGGGRSKWSRAAGERSL